METVGLSARTTGDKRQVIYSGEVLAEFDIISDDYAFTHASEFARLFSLAIGEGKSVTDARNYAYSKL